MRNIGFSGLGRMGEPMARRLLQADYALTVHNRTREKAERLLAEGARWAGSPREVAQQSEMVITMLTDSPAVEEVYAGPAGVLEGAHEGLIAVDMSTISPEVSANLAELAETHGVRFLDSPVSGTVGPATEGTLVLFVGGDAATLNEVRDVLSVLGKTIHHIGENGRGCAFKLVVNLILAASVQGLAEGLALSARAGLSLQQTWDVLKDLSVVSPAMRGKGPSMVQGRFPSSFALRLMEKDLALVLEYARHVGAGTPVAATVQQSFMAATLAGLGEEDFAAIAAWLLPKQPPA